MDEKIQIVNQDDQPLGYATREEAWAKKLRHRFVRIIIVNKDGDVLLQKRSSLKKKYPNRWTDAATGHVDYGETYEIAARRELDEEIGVKTPLDFLSKFYIEDDSDNKTTRAFHGVFRGRIPNDTELKVEPSEVSEVKWFKPEELKRMVATNPEEFTPGLIEVVKRCI